MESYKIIYNIKGKIPFRIKIFLIYMIYQIQSILYCILGKKFSFHTHKKKMYILLSTDYPNLGDHAMSYAQIKFLKERFEDYELVEITVNQVLKYLDYIKKVIKPEDVITLKGGGNIGVEYFREELIRRKIIKYFPQNKIVIFPQTVYFPDTRFGRKEFKNTIQIFQTHKRLYLFLRDRKSYQIIESKINRHVYLCPDIVWSLGEVKIEKEKTCDVLICMRNDVEGIYTKKEKEELESVVNMVCKNIEKEDTIKPYYIGPENRKEELVKIWNKISSARIVITDRLHGMIFSVITGVPCIVLSTYNHKLEGQYEWIKDKEYVAYISTDVQELPNIIKKMFLLEKEDYKKNIWDNYFIKIEEVIRS